MSKLKPKLHEARILPTNQAQGQFTSGRQNAIKSKKKNRWNRLKHFFLFLGWLLGVAASSWALEKGEFWSQDVYKFLFNLVISACGIPIMHKLVIPLLRSHDDRKRYPWYWPFLVGLISGVVGRLLAYGLTNPSLLFGDPILSLGSGIVSIMGNLSKRI